MTTLQITEATLRQAGFSKPKQANSFFPPGDSETHVHLGVPSNVSGGKWKDGYVYVTYVSLKVDDQTYSNLLKNEETGKFSPKLWDDKPWPPHLYDAVAALGILEEV